MCVCLSVCVCAKANLKSTRNFPEGMTIGNHTLRNSLPDLVVNVDSPEAFCKSATDFLIIIFYT